jgi:S1-C subfamily serine protease
MMRIFATIFFGFVLMFGFASPAVASDEALAAYNRGDFATALRLWRSLADQGQPDAMYNLGLMYAQGAAVPQNYAEAARWYGLAAEYGNPDAQAALGLQYVMGQGVPENYILSYTWLSLAAARGNQIAIRGREIPLRFLTPQQVAYAQNLAAAWRPKVPPAPKPQAPSVSSGTAFFINAKGEALTNAHVVEECQQIRVNGRAARLLARDTKNDLALLATGQHPAQWANWRLEVRLGEDVIAFGFPLTGTLSSSGNVTTGIVTALAGLGDDSRFLQISAPVQPGNSGGPLFDRYGNVVGVVVAKLNALKIASATGDIPQNVNFAIKASVAKAFLDAQRQPNPFDQFDVLPPDAVQTPLDHPVAPMLSTPDIAARAQALAVQVVCIQ